MNGQKEFDELTAAIAQHNKAIAKTILGAERSLVSAKEQLSQAEKALDILKTYIIHIVEKKYDI